MDSLRGLGDTGRDLDQAVEDTELDDDAVMDAPHAFGTDERRMHVRAYNYWAKLLGNRRLPSIEDLDPENIEDFGPNSVLLDFTSGIENPALPYVGKALREECALEDGVEFLNEVPSRSLLSRITDHYMQIIANEAPIGFEAEFVNERGASILYRGILLPFSSDDDTIDFVYGVINWKELADKQTTDALIRQIDNAVQSAPRKPSIPAWADGPEENIDETLSAAEADAHAPGEEGEDDDFLSMDGAAPDGPPVYEEVLDLDLSLALDGVDGEDVDGEDGAAAEFAETALDENAGLADWLAAARGLAEIADHSEDRSRLALYRAIERAYDFALVARDHAEDYEALLEDAGIKAQARAPMTPVAKLVFGADYDKTRLTEYATVLGFALRTSVPRGALAEVIQGHEGGLKGIVRAERARRQGRTPGTPLQQQTAMARDKLRETEPLPLDAVVSQEEFVVLVARRTQHGLGIVAALDADDALTGSVLRKAAG